MKILHIIPNLIKGGAQRLAIDICRELNKRNGVEVKLIYFEGENEFEFLTKEIDVKRISVTYELSFRKKNRIDFTEYEKILDAFQPDVIHSHLYLAELISREFPRTGILYFTHCHDNMVQLNRPEFSTLLNKQKLVAALERKRLMKRYHASDNYFIAIADDGVAYLKENLPVGLSSKVFLLHNAINVESFGVERKQLSSNKRMINVGNFIPKKNQLFLIDVLARLKARGYNIELTLVGDGMTRKVVEDKVYQLELSDQVEFKGKTDNIQHELNNSNIYVHSAKYEPFGLVLLEAMVAGLPVVSLDGKGNRDLIRDGINGYLVNQGDVERFVQCVIDLMSDGDLYKRIQDEGYETGKEHDIRPYVDRLLELYALENN